MERAPPQAIPFTAAITGFHMSLDFGFTLAPGSLSWNGDETGPVSSRRWDALVLVDQVVLGDDLLTVDAAAERLVAGAGHDDHPHVLVAPQPTPQRLELVLHLLIEGVVPLGPVQGDRGHPSSCSYNSVSNEVSTSLPPSRGPPTESCTH
jgi:hypothetical protein